MIEMYYIYPCIVISFAPMDSWSLPSKGCGFIEAIAGCIYNLFNGIGDRVI